MDLELREAERAYSLAPTDPSAQRDLLRAWVRSGRTIVPGDHYMFANAFNSNRSIKAALIAFGRKLADRIAELVDADLNDFFHNNTASTFWVYVDETSTYPGQNTVNVRLNIGKYHTNLSRRVEDIGTGYIPDDSSPNGYRWRFTNQAVTVRLDTLERRIQNTLHTESGLNALRLTEASIEQMGISAGARYRARGDPRYVYHAIILPFYLDMPFSLGVAKAILDNYA